MSTKPNLKREHTLKVPLNDPEVEKLRQFCTGLGQSVAPFVRDLVSAHIRQETNRSPGKRRSEWPSSGHQRGHAQRFPGRPAAAGAGKRMHL